MLHSRFAKVVSFPLVPWVLFVASPFALYFSGWYAATLDSTVLHELLHLHFLVVGSLFFWPLLGIDPVPGAAPTPSGCCSSARRCRSTPSSASRS